MARHLAGYIAGSEQLTHISRGPEGHGLWHLGTVGQVTAGTGLVLNVGGIAASEYAINGSVVAIAYTAATATITAAHATLPRRDIVTIDTAGAVAVTAGTPATNPAPPAIGTTKLALAEVLVGAAVTGITAGNITDKRQLLSGRRIVRKTGDQTVNNSSSLVNDSALVFWIETGEIWLATYYLVTAIPTAPGFQWDHTLDSGGNPAAGYLQFFEGRQSGGTSQYTSQGTGTTRANGSIAVPGFTIGAVVLVSQLTNGGVGSICRFQWAQATAVAANTQVLTGSFVQLERLL